MAKLISADELYKRRGVFADDIGKHGWREAINNLPTAEPERKKGKWVYEDEMTCSVCGFECDDPYYLGDAKYCPSCGARMEG